MLSSMKAIKVDKFHESFTKVVGYYIRGIISHDEFILELNLVSADYLGNAHEDTNDCDWCKEDREIVSKAWERIGFRSIY